MKATNFDIRISKETALDLIKTLYSENGSRGNSLKEELGIEIMCKEYGEDKDWVGLESTDYQTILEGEEYKTFEIWLPIEMQVQNIKL